MLNTLKNKVPINTHEQTSVEKEIKQVHNVSKEQPSCLVLIPNRLQTKSSIVRAVHSKVQLSCNSHDNSLHYFHAHCEYDVGELSEYAGSISCCEVIIK